MVARLQESQLINIMKLNLLPVSIVSVMFGLGCVQENPNFLGAKDITSSGTITDSAGETLKLKAFIVLGETTGAELKKLNNSRIFGGGGRAPHERSIVINSFRLKVGSETFSVPAAGLKDLTFPSLPDSLNFGKDGDNVVVSFKGGEGEFVYVCRLYVSESGFRKRAVDEVLNPNFRNVEIIFPH